MATNQPPAVVKTSTLWKTVQQWLKPLASLKLTVALFALSIFLVLFGTLAQTDKDMWEVINDYFRSWIAIVDVQVLFPRAWCPPSMHDIPGRFPFPGGMTLGVMLSINLLAAHVSRFKTQARGLRLWLGLGVIVAGTALTTLVILAGRLGSGEEGESSLGSTWMTLWWAINLGLVVAWIANTALLVSTFFSEERVLTRWISGSVSVGLAGWLGWFFIGGESAYIGDPAMRILWQLVQGGASGAVLLGGCILVFKKRGGIVLIHTGVALMMLGVLLGSYAVEERMMIREGEKANFTLDIRSIEIAVTDRTSSDTEDHITVIPRSFLLESWYANDEEATRPFSFAGLFRQSGDPVVGHEELPFKVEVLRYFENSNIRAPKPGEKNLATSGEGLHTVAEAKRAAGGADSSGAVDMASAYVRLTAKDGSKLGTYLLTQFASSVGRSESVEVDGHRYDVQLNFKRTYKPYSLRLIDVRKDDYIGTNTPKNYSSDLRLVEDSDRHKVDRPVHIWMNNPLRYAGETFYQSSYHQENGVEVTTLQVVENTGWMIPYVACMLAAIGLYWHFQSVLLRFLNKQTTPVVPARLSSTEGEVVDAVLPGDASPKLPLKSKSLPVGNRSLASPATSSSNKSIADYVVPIVVVLIFSMWLGGIAIPRRSSKNKMNVEAFGSLPSAYGGRIKPLDTVARNSLRIISENRETFKDGDGERRPAMIWLLDVISGSKRAEQHRVFRITDLQVLHTLGLGRRPGYAYSYSEFIPKMDEFRKQVGDANQTQREGIENLTHYQKKILALNKKLELFFELREAHRLPKPDLNDAYEEANYLLALVNVSEKIGQARVPYSVPGGEHDRSWEPLIKTAARMWVQDLAKDRKASTPEELALAMTEQIMTEERIQEFVESKMMRQVEQIIRSTNPNVKDEEIGQLAKEKFASLPAAVRENFIRNMRQSVLEDKVTIQQNIKSAIASALGSAKLTDRPDEATRLMSNMLTAFHDDDVKTFNASVAEYRRAVGDNPPEGFSYFKTSFEQFYNRVSPFYCCTILYIIAFLFSALSWAVWRRPFHRAAMGLVILAFIVHTLALIARMYISDRPFVVVTNLYSSAIFIGWAGVLAGIVIDMIFRIGIGNVVAEVLGFVTMLIANFLAGEGDTLSVMQAVLDTNFWLATHVTCISLGYATTFIAGFIGIAYIALGMTTPFLTKEVSKIFARIIYGVLCFGIFFSYVGTVLGGLWADDSWGRFWGWDPKENGALMIVIWVALVLHARWGAMVKERGLAVLAVVGNIVTAWSWFGVNELGVGLHSYGFTEGMLLKLMLFGAGMALVIGVGCLPKDLWWSFREQQLLDDAHRRQV